MRSRGSRTLPLTVDVLRYMGGWATKITGTTIPEE
jgi:hypothetical protein